MERRAEGHSHGQERPAPESSSLLAPLTVPLLPTLPPGSTWLSFRLFQMDLTRDTQRGGLIPVLREARRFCLEHLTFQEARSIFPTVSSRLGGAVGRAAHPDVPGLGPPGSSGGVTWLSSPEEGAPGPAASWTGVSQPVSPLPLAVGGYPVAPAIAGFARAPRCQFAEFLWLSAGIQESKES